jgi:hypothetical protein
LRSPLKRSVRRLEQVDFMRTILTLCLFLLAGSFVEAQTISDDDKRSFDELKPIKIDVDGDRKPDTIQPRVYALVPDCTKGKPVKFSDIQHWIAFDLTLATGRRIPSFFKYRYGTDQSSYWVYAVISAGDIDRDGRTDLVFYAGDDSSDETVILINKGDRFIVRSRKRGGDSQ